MIIPDPGIPAYDVIAMPQSTTDSYKRNRTNPNATFLKNQEHPTSRGIYVVNGETTPDLVRDLTNGGINLKLSGHVADENNSLEQSRANTSYG